MIKLSRPERYILIFLVTALILGIAISAAKKLRSPARVTIERFDAARYKDTGDDLSASYEKIDINNAGVEELKKLKGIGRAVAERIVAYRDQNGSFASIDDIKNVKGIGVALFEKIRNRIKTE